jgi:capsular polysaccharide biosynthesis protein
MGNEGRIRRSVRGARWVVVVGIVVGAAVGLLADLHLDHTPVSSTSQLLVSDGALGQSSADAASTEDQYVSARMATYAQLATDDTVLAPVAAQLGTTVPALQQVVRATPVDGTTVLSLAVRAATPAEATADDAAVTGAVAAAITSAETFGSNPSLVAVTVASPPSTPDPISVPPLGLVSVAGALAGGLLVLLGAVLWGSGLIQRLGRRVDDAVFADPAQTIGS